MLRRNVLIFHNAALGDFVLTWPVAVALSRVMAQSRVRYVTAGEKGRLAEKAIGTEHADVEAGWHALHGDGLELAEAPAKALAGLQLAVVFARGEASVFVANVRRHAGDVPVLVIEPRPPGGTHVWRHHVEQLRAVPWLATAVEQVQMSAMARGLCPAPPADASNIVIHPGSGAARKNWPAERFVEAANLLRAAGRRVTFTIGEVEREQFPADMLRAMASTATIVAPRSLVELYDTLATAAVYVGNDSGPTHLAAALGRRVVAMFGPTSDAAAWGPQGPDVTVLPFESGASQVAAAVGV